MYVSDYADPPVVSPRKHEILMVGQQMGIFLCMRCAALHRKLGTHISKVKSLTMDSWSSDQVDVSEISNSAIEHD